MAIGDNSKSRLGGLTSMEVQEVQRQIAGAAAGSISSDSITEGFSNLFFTAERAQDAISLALTDSGRIDLTYNDGANTISADIIAGSITNTYVGAGLDAVKIAAGLVSNTEFGYLDGVTSGIQAQLNAKAASLGIDDNYVTDAQLIAISNTSGTNTGDQASIVGITGTKAQFDTAVTDGNFLYVGDASSYTDEMAQDAVGNILTDSSTIDFTYNDAGNTITAAFINAAGYITSLSGAVLTDQTVGQTIGATGARLTKLWATDVTVSNAIAGSITGNAGTVTNGVYTTGAGTVFLSPSGSAASLTSFPTLNQDTTGKSAKTDALNSATTIVNVAAATAPSSGQVLTATSSTAATWQTPLTYQPLDSDLTTLAGLTATTDNFVVSVASAWASRTPAQVKTTLALNNVENTALSTWAGSANITTLGTIATGSWHGTVIDGTYLNYNTTNLKVTSSQLNTIQNIATSSSPTFANLNLPAGGVVNINSVRSLYNDSTNFNLFLGLSGNLATTAFYNNAYGDHALYSVTTGNNNMAFGAYSLNLLQDGGNNTAVGVSAVRYNVSGLDNVGIGTNSLLNTTGSENIGIGDSAGRDNTSGTGNTHIGGQSGYTGGATTYSYSGTFGYAAQVGASNTIAIGGVAAGGVATDIISGGTTASAKLHLIKTTEQLRLGYDASNYASFVVGSSGILDITPTGARITLGKPVRLKGYTVATLPAGVQGDVAFVTDALAPTFLATVVGGGAVVTPVFFDGATWKGG